jgi:hypothetical protein
MDSPSPPLLYPPEAPLIRTFIDVTPAGTVQVCADPVYEKLVVVAAKAPELDETKGKSDEKRTKMTEPLFNRMFLG